MKSLFNLAAGVVACLAATCAAAGTYPDRSIRLVVPAAAGGSTDLGARVIGDLLGKELGVPVIVENKGGGGGRIGAAYVASAKADGYTLLYGNSITNALLPAAIEQAVQSPTLPAKMEGSGFVPEYENPQALADLMAKDTQKFRKISQQAHLHLD